ncbi:hydroxymethylglutaryl-CoA lyase [Paenalcaligenes hominis]|uniref:hydroxymethylglutaryl-CoA lyase n=1 Tax=Paenalcaligenes hominis TaxID=643674 RepID=UPI00352422A6
MSLSAIYPPHQLCLREVGLRDGLQLVKQFPTTADKKAWLHQEHKAGVRYFEVGSFLPAHRFPQFADVRELIEFAKTLDQTVVSALVLNERGVVDALGTAVDEIMYVVSATEQHSLANSGKTRAQAIELLQRAVELRDQQAHPTIISTGISMAFGCSLEGRVNPDEVLTLIAQCFNAGADMVALADTVGYANPRQVRDLMRTALDAFPNRAIGLHLHDTRGLAIANATVALEEGVRILDGSLAGLGGCPFAPGATGNIVFEDLVYLCDSMGLPTTIDLTELLKARQVVAASMPNELLQGALAQAGLPRL